MWVLPRPFRPGRPRHGACALNADFLARFERDQHELQAFAVLEDTLEIVVLLREFLDIVKESRHSFFACHVTGLSH